MAVTGAQKMKGAAPPQSTPEEELGAVGGSDPAEGI